MKDKIEEWELQAFLEWKRGTLFEWLCEERTRVRTATLEEVVRLSNDAGV